MSTATAPAAYLRSRGGRVVHRAGCAQAHAANMVSWTWADGKTPPQIADEAAMLGIRYRYCHACIPNCPDPCTGRHEP